jgi:hypothetical protein
VLFSDNDCSNVAMAQISTTGCNDGTQFSCSSDADTLPSLPNIGFTQFDNDACTLNPYNAPTVALFASGCAESKMFSCGTVNGTQAGTLSIYTDSTGKGLCPAGKNVDTTQLVGNCVEGRIFTCEYAPPSNNSASGVASSAIAMIFAAFVALIAGRSL